MATHSSILAWRIPWTDEPGRLQSMGSQRVRHNWANNAHTHVRVRKGGGMTEAEAEVMRTQVLPPGSKKTAFPLGPPETVQPCRHPDPSQNPYSNHRKLIQRSWVLLSEISHWRTLSWEVRGSVFCIKKITLLLRVDCSVSQEINHKALDII